MEKDEQMNFPQEAMLEFKTDTTDEEQMPLREAENGHFEQENVITVVEEFETEVNSQAEQQASDMDTASEHVSDEMALSLENEQKTRDGNYGDKLVELIKDLRKDNQELKNELTNMQRQMTALNQEVVKLAENGERTAIQLNQVNDRLHKENQDLKNGLYDSLRLPILEDVIELSSDTVLEINRLKKAGEVESVKILEDVLDDIHLVLKRHDVEVYQPKEGDTYQPIVEKILKVLDTDDPEKDRKIAENRGFGYRLLENKGEKIVIIKDEEQGMQKIIAPCKVYVYKFQ